MPTHSRSIIYTMKGGDENISSSDMLERCKFVLFKISYFTNLRISLRYCTKDNINKTILSLNELDHSKDNVEIISDYIVRRLDLGINDDFKNIDFFFLSYSYIK